MIPRLRPFSSRRGSAAFGENVKAEIQKQLAGLSRRAIAEKAIEGSRIIIVDDMKSAIDVANRYALPNI